MNQDFNTFELAGIYESQGCFQEALEMYQALEKKDPTGKKNPTRDAEVKAAVNRMELAIQNQSEEPEHYSKQTPIQPLEQTLDAMPEKKIEQLLEQWLTLMVLDKRLSAFKRVKKRL